MHKSFKHGYSVDPTKSLQAAELEDGDHLTAIAIQRKLAATDPSFALFCSGGDRVTCGGIHFWVVTVAARPSSAQRCPPGSSENPPSFELPR
jgi:hypothetical protein